MQREGESLSNVLMDPYAKPDDRAGGPSCVRREYFFVILVSLVNVVVIWTNSER